MRLPLMVIPACALLAAGPTLAQTNDSGAFPGSARPQEAAIAAAPLPYRDEAISFDAVPGVRLSGTLTLPPGAGPFAAAVLIAGSGKHDRDETVAGHKPMLVLADALARQGYAVLRYDKRGAARSTGDFDAATTLDFAGDAAAAVRYLRSRPDIRPAGIGVIGHSEGGTIAALLAVKDPGLAYVVMMAGFAAPGGLLVAEQIRRVDIANGVAPAAASQTFELNRKLFTAIAAAKDEREAEQKVSLVLASIKPSAPKSEGDQALMFARMPYMRFILSYDPTPSLRRLRVPVLALAGSKDLVVPPDVNLPALRRSLARDPEVKVVELVGLNHFFQPAKTGLPQEFSTIEETLAPAVTAAIIRWVRSHTPANVH